MRWNEGRQTMVDSPSQKPEQLLVLGMGLTEQNVERRRRLVALDATDTKHITAIKELVVSRAGEFTAAFFDHLAGLEEARPLLANRPLLERARQLKAEHLIAMVQGEYGVAYVLQRLELGLLYSKAGLELRVFLGAFHHLLRTVGFAVLERAGSEVLDGFQSFMSLKKVAFLDIGIIVDVIVFEKQRVIRQQQDAIRELSTPVLQLRDRLLLLPIIGVIDTHRARLITESLLTSIRSNRAKVVVMDITGVATIDSKVANHLIQTVTAARLMGASVIVTGLSADVAQSLVALGIDLTKLNTIGDLQGGIEEAEHMLGYRVVQRSEGAAQPAHG
jgi:rsbT co-antagonist protein RsbR